MIVRAMVTSIGGQSMVAPLRTVLLCPPQVAGWCAPERAGRWKELGYGHPPNHELAAGQFLELSRLLAENSIEVVLLPGTPALSMDAVYVHDPSLITDHGAVCLAMGKPARDGEPQAHREAFAALGVPVLGKIEAPGAVEGGDVVWLDAETLLVGRGYRTNACGMEQLRALLGPLGVQVISAPLPHGGGPDVCLHLMSLMSMLDAHTALVDLPLLAVETVELLSRHRIRLIEIDPAERASLGCNVLSIGNWKLVALAENEKTNRRLRAAGFEVLCFHGSELAINGGGGPTCLTRPVLRKS